MATAQEIDALLPQTQCGKCGFKGCFPYAEAIVNNTADINQCPPGGQSNIDALAELLGITSKALNIQFGSSSPPQQAVILADQCIGCVKCIAACPVDAIVGSPKMLHTVIQDECNGCELCIPACPVDCIDLLSISPLSDLERQQRAQLNRRRHYARLAREQREKIEHQEKLQKKMALLQKFKVKQSVETK